jgi:O-acetyl-ADP-ribose deacetylase (regulator of RNase III)
MSDMPHFGRPAFQSFSKVSQNFQKFQFVVSKSSNPKMERTTKNQSAHHQKRKNYQDLGLEKLIQWYGSALDSETISMVFQQNSSDMDKTIAQLTSLTDIIPKDDFQASATSQQEPKQGTGKHQLREMKADLFSCNEAVSLVHCISKDIRMGKGIAVEFKKRFGGCVASFACLLLSGVEDLQQQNKAIGEVAVLKRGKKSIFYLITKENYWNKPTYDDLKSSLLDLQGHCLSQGITSLAMPRIGCGLGKACRFLA